MGSKTTKLVLLDSLVNKMVADFKMNQEKLKQLQAQVRIGGKGTARRKKKVVHRTATTDDKKLQSSLKKLSVNNIPGIEEVNMIKDDGTVIHFNNPKVQASLAANTFAVTGHAENKQITEMLPGILNQLGAESLTHLKRKMMKSLIWLKTSMKCLKMRQQRRMPKFQKLQRPQRPRHQPLKLPLLLMLLLLQLKNKCKAASTFGHF